MYCKACGAELNDAAVICPSCASATDNFRVGAGAADPLTTGVLIAAYSLAVLVPIVGMAAAVYAFAKDRPGHGMALMALGVFCTAVWAASYRG